MARKFWGVAPGVCAAMLWGAGAAWAQSPAEEGEWSSAETWPISATHTLLLPSGKVMFFGEFDEGLLPPQQWDPATGQLSLFPKADYNIFCAGHSFLEDGRVLVTGGHELSHVGYRYTRLFDSVDFTWSNAPDMNERRWYPTNTTLPNGDVVILSGEMASAGDNNPLPQVYEAKTGTLRDLTGAVREVPYYPRTFVAPNGKVFCAGPKPTSLYLDVEKTGTWFEIAESIHRGDRTYAPAVYIDGKVYTIGGDDPPVASMEVIDLNAPVPAWQARAPMSVPRRQHNAVALPDGQIFVAGGSSGEGFNNGSAAVYTSELYNPDTDSWKTMASYRDFHGYHSTALLLPDGRVLLAGGRKIRTAQVFTPPYLLKGLPRPTVSAAPAEVLPGTTFTISTPDASRVQKVTLSALAAVTHSFDMGGRLLTLPFTAGSGDLTVTAPLNNFIAPPGYYQLFVVNDEGVPSVGKMIRIGKVAPKMQRVISLADEWRYDDSAVDQGTAWLSASYDDSQWKTGPGQLGYGDEDEATVLNRTVPSQPTVYFRKKIVLDRAVAAANLEVLYDDAVAIWVNGRLVYYNNVGNGLDYGVYATAATDNAYVRLGIPLIPNPFVIGENTVAALVKQVSATSTDLTFALGLEVELSAAPIPDAIKVLAPNGGETLVAGSTTEIRWATSGSVPSVDVAYSSNNGATWTTLESGGANDGTFTWTLPTAGTTKALVRVSKKGTPATSDLSDAPFVIAGEVRSQPIVWGDTWAYEDSGNDPGAAWNTLTFDDGAWRRGPAELGYGDKDEATLLTPMSPAQTSVYFRKKLTLDGTVTYAKLRVRYDDGVVVFVNGVQVLARNVDRGIEHTRYATDTEDNAETEVVLPLITNPFVSGENIVAVMIKQVGKTSPDLSFNLSLDLGVTTVPARASRQKAPPARGVVPAAAPAPKK
ncbi:DUF1929 domain-containing protein [Myxococcaceae bacterium GXIMD 01537]